MIRYFGENNTEESDARSLFRRGLETNKKMRASLVLACPHVGFHKYFYKEYLRFYEINFNLLMFFIRESKDE